MRQKCQSISAEKNIAIAEEVDRLLAAGFIREAHYLEWMSNVIRMNPKNEEKTSVITDRGLYCYTAMPFGLKNAGATYQRLVNQWDSGTTLERFEGDFRDTEEVPDEVEPGKMRIQHRIGKFLGFMVSKREIKANPEKVEAILNIAPPQSIKEVQRLARQVAALNSSSCRAKGGVGVHIVTSEGEEYNYAIKLAFKTTNNEAEYEALLSGLAVARSLGATEIEVRADS
ncbi:uncharacterized protein LOC121267276 [Juglans microcarpa x Juglans regia]|uniref:uncharacterized protein LOC121267276 n=1 Tax=Juglans microcarpa x Juglans regia TaxID=2249226 RepID=UPI001B7EB9ED|nr:uncharacterized protein LOC121267276 [Juglans microcarpa x Juglans regia]